MKLNVIDRHKKAVVKLCSPDGGQIILKNTDFDRHEMRPGTIWLAPGGDKAEVLSVTAYGFLLLITRFRSDEDDELRWVSLDWRPIDLYILKEEAVSSKELKTLVADQSSFLLQKSDLGTLVYHVDTQRQLSELTWIKPEIVPAQPLATLRTALA